MSPSKVACMSVSLALAGGVAAGTPIVKRSESTALGGTILVTLKGHTLYRSSVEKNGRVACVSTRCLAYWKPLLVPAGSKPAGAPGLGTVKRPDGRVQVTFKGSPLYSYVRDAKPGDARGNGIKDAGVWRVVVVSGPAAPPIATTPSPTPPGDGYGREP